MIHIRSGEIIPVFALYGILVGLYLLPWPLQDSFPSDHDVWANLAMFETLKADLQHLFVSGPSVTFGYPTIHPRINYGLDYFSGLIYLGVEFFLSNPIWSYAVYLWVLLVMNSTSWFLLMRTFGIGRTAAVISGFLVMANPFVAGNLDNPNFLTFFPSWFALALYRKEAKIQSELNLTFVTWLILIQLLMNPYGLVLLVPLVLPECRYVFFRILKAQNLFFWTGAFLPALLLVAVFWKIYISSSDSNLFHPTREFTSAANLLCVRDYFSGMKGALLSFPNFVSRYKSNLDFSKTAFPGWGILYSGIAGVIFFKYQWRIRILLLLVLGFLLSSIILEFILPILNSNTQEFFLFDFFRLPYRFYFLSIMALAWSSAVFFNRIKNPLTAIILTSVQVFGLVFTYPNYKSQEVLDLTDEVSNQLKSLPYSPTAYFPSALFGETEDKREYRYMLINAKLRSVTYNGNFAFFEKCRLQTDSVFRKGPVSFGEKYQPQNLVIFNEAIISDDSIRHNLKKLGYRIKETGFGLIAWRSRQEPD